MDVVFKNAEVRNVGSEKGFCNDLFCPFCFKYVQVLKNGLGMSIMDEPTVYVKDRKKEYFVNYDKYIRAYNMSWPIDKYDPKLMGQESNDTVKFIDVAGCSSLNHNLGIILVGLASEYGEAEYRPIYDWIKANKSKIPKEMLKEFKQEMA